jgi:hypothetical protein
MDQQARSLIGTRTRDNLAPPLPILLRIPRFEGEAGPPAPPHRPTSRTMPPTPAIRPVPFEVFAPGPLSGLPARMGRRSLLGLVLVTVVFIGIGWHLWRIASDCAAVPAQLPRRETEMRPHEQTDSPSPVAVSFVPKIIPVEEPRP